MRRPFYYTDNTSHKLKAAIRQLESIEVSRATPSRLTPSEVAGIAKAIRELTALRDDRDHRRLREENARKAALLAAEQETANER